MVFRSSSGTPSDEISVLHLHGWEMPVFPSGTTTQCSGWNTGTTYDIVSGPCVSGVLSTLGTEPSHTTARTSTVHSWDVGWSLTVAPSQSPCTPTPADAGSERSKMVDICMCDAHDCPNSKTCRRSPDSGTVPDAYRQTWSNFKQEGKDCHAYWMIPMDVIRERRRAN